MTKLRILMLLSNAYRPDPRVAREANALTQSGHRVTVFCWDRRGEFAEHETQQGVEIVRFHGAQTTYGLGARQILHIPRFWQAAYRFILASRPDVIHCHDLDTLYPGVRAKQKIGCGLLYDAHEHYPALMSLYLPKYWVKALARFEQSLYRKADAVITASSVLADEWRAKGIKSVSVIGNYAMLNAFDEIRPEDIAGEKSALGLTPDDLIIAYIGGFSRNREILPFIEAGRDLPGVSLQIWGDGHQRKLVQEAIGNASNIFYRGWLQEAKVPLYTRVADAIYYCLRRDYPGAIYNAPNTLSNAMAAGKPIIANDVGDLGRIVRQTGCGQLLSDVQSATIRHAIEELRDPELRDRYGKSGREAAEREYNGELASQKLLSIYDQLGYSR